MVRDVVHFVFGVFGNISGLSVTLSPTITFTRILKNKSTQQFSGIPYVMTLISCLFSAWYGVPFVSEGNMLVLTINATGAAVEAIYVLIFLTYAPKKDKGNILWLLTFGLSVFASVDFISVFAVHGNNRKLLSGFAASIFVMIIMYAWPLSVMVPNGFGRGLGAVQLILYAIYRDQIH